MKGRQQMETTDDSEKRIKDDSTEIERFQLKRFKKLLFSLTQTEEEKSEVTECFSSLKERNQNAFYQNGCRLLHSFLSIKKTFPNNEKLFVLCFLMKGISSSLSAETNKSILTSLGSLLDDESKEKYSHEILKRAMKTKYSFFGEDGDEYACLKPFWHEIEYSEETEPPQINNTVPVYLLCKRVPNNSLFTKWMDELNVVFMRHGESSSSEERALISSLALRNKLFCETQVKRKRTFLQKENNTKETLLRNIGLNKKQVEDFFKRYNEINSIKMLYDSNVDRKTAEKCHEKIDNKGATITFIKKGNKFIGGITYQDWSSQREIVFDAYANIFSISDEMKVFPVQKKERALLITP